MSSGKLHHDLINQLAIVQGHIRILTKVNKGEKEMSLEGQHTRLQKTAQAIEESLNLAGEIKKLLKAQD